MNEFEKQILGIEQGLTKNNKPFTILHTISNFDEYAIDTRGAKGTKVETTYISSLINLNLGDVVTFVYQPGYQGKAVVTGVNLIEK